MQSFNTKDSNTFESFESKDSEVEQSDNEVVESFDRSFQNFDTLSTKNSELEQSDNEVVESFDRKFEITDEESLPDSGSFDTKDSHVSISKFVIFDKNSLDNIEQSHSCASLSTCAGSRSQGSEKLNTDGRCKPRSQRQIEAYKRNFSARKSIELKVEELDSRLRHLQSLVLSLLSR